MRLFAKLIDGNHRLNSDILSDWWGSPWTERVHINKNCDSLLQLAAIAKSVSISRRLIDWGADINEQPQYGRYGSALSAAARMERTAEAYGGNKEVIELLIKSGAEVNVQLQYGQYGSALAAASAFEGNKEVVKLLIKSGAEVNELL
jgi:ankyrin repeat protein